MTLANPRARHHVLGIVALALFAALFTRLWYLQVLTTDDFVAAARNNRTEEVIIEAPRGRILDRNAQTLVENRRTIQVTISYQDFTALEPPRQSELLRRLAARLNEDQLLQRSGEREPNDPGAEPDATIPDPSAPVDEVADDPPRHPPAGVATGARNPDGQTDASEAPPAPVTEETLRARLNDDRFSKFKPVPVATDISEDLEIYLRENPEDYPTVTVERVTVRSYRYGALLAHVLGYVGAITEDELALVQNREKPYENDDDIGKTGIEAGMEHQLRGTPGRVVYEVDARNRPIKELSRTAPRPGRDVYLTVDINLQYLMEKGMAAEIERRRGVRDNGCFLPGGCQPPGAAGVVLDPNNGQVLAMASYPTYDPNLFVGGISTRDYQAISAQGRVDEHHNPLLNRAISGEYAAGSTFKLFSAYAGLATGQLDPNFAYDDTGTYEFSPGNVKRNAGGIGTGAVDLTRAITKSSDTYFYKLGNETWQRRDVIGETALQDEMVKWGLGQPTGIDLANEATGRVPTPEWLRDYSDEINADDPALAEDAGTWRGGTSANTTIGQGAVLVTPLQLANGYAILANGGLIYLPRLVLQVADYSAATNIEVPETQVIGEVPLPPQWRDPLVSGFDGVTKDVGGVRGTAASAFEGVDQSQCSISGKTGTAQVQGKNDSSLFTSFAPSQGATIATAIVFEQAGFGGSVAAPLTRRLLEPFALSGCTIDPPDPPDGPPVRSAWAPAPLGGWFDVEAAMEEFTPGPSQGID